MNSDREKVLYKGPESNWTWRLGKRGETPDVPVAFSLGACYFPRSLISISPEQGGPGSRTNSAVPADSFTVSSTPWGLSQNNLWS